MGLTVALDSPGHHRATISGGGSLWSADRELVNHGLQLTAGLEVNGRELRNDRLVVVEDRVELLEGRMKPLQVKVVPADCVVKH